MREEQTKMANKLRGKNWFSVGNIALHCLVSTATVRRWIKSGEIPATQLPSGHYRVRGADFDDFLKRHDMPLAGKQGLYGLSELQTKLLEVVVRGTGGITLRELAERVGVPPIVAGRVVRKLLDEGVIRKEENRYYAVELEQTSR